jgi:hypothetical protein
MCAAADHRFDLLDGQQRPADRIQRMVHRRGEVAAGVEQGPVEVEPHDIE